MGRKWKERTDIFNIKDEAGNIYRLVQFTEFEDTTTFGKPKEVTELRSTYETDGYTVIRVGENEFELENLLTSEKIRAIRKL